MSTQSAQLPAPRRAVDGVSFTVVVECVSRECLIRDEALQHLSSLKTGNGKTADTMEIFAAFENTIQGVARRLVSAGVKGTPLVMTANTFFRPPHAS